MRARHQSMKRTGLEEAKGRSGERARKALGHFKGLLCGPCVTFLLKPQTSLTPEPWVRLSFYLFAQKLTKGFSEVPKVQNRDSRQKGQPRPKPTTRK